MSAVCHSFSPIVKYWTGGQSDTVSMPFSQWSNQGSRSELKSTPASGPNSKSPNLVLSVVVGPWNQGPRIMRWLFRARAERARVDIPLKLLMVPLRNVSNQLPKWQMGASTRSYPVATFH